MSRRVLIAIAVVIALLAVAAAIASFQLPSIAAGGLLYPARNETLPDRPSSCVDRDFAGEGVTLRGWYCKGEGRRRATIVYLHGVADNRGSGVGAIRRFTPKGLDVIAYDSRRHGKSEGEICTYGFYEKVDLRRVIETAQPGPVILIGASLGAAVSLQEAAVNRRVTGVVAAETFADLRTVAIERAPFFLWPAAIDQAIRIAEERGGFDIDAVSPVDAAASIKVPVLLIHGADDVDTKAEHAERVMEALGGPKRLLLLKGVAHNQSLSDARTWTEIEGWIDAVLRVTAR